MKLKCVYSSEFSKNPLFIEGNMYEIISGEDEHYYVTTEKGSSVYVPLNGKIWRFKIVSDEQIVSDEREDIIFEIESLIKQLNHEFDKLKNLI